jgi:hypothetical protein
MEKMHIEATKSTPSIEYVEEKNALVIKGQSYPENAAKFYEPITGWIADAISSNDGLVLDIELIYLNTSSSKCIINILDMLEDAFNSGKKIELNWYYDVENESSLECAEEFKEDMNFPFNITAITS